MYDFLTELPEIESSLAKITDKSKYLLSNP